MTIPAVVPNATPNVGFIRPEVAKLLPLYRVIRDCINGESAVKEAKDLYLPKPMSSGDSIADEKRYKDLLQRAVFYNVVRKTLQGLNGLVFQADPIIELNPSIEILRNNANGEGLSLLQMMKQAFDTVAAYSRCGLFVDYSYSPVGENAKTDEGARPTINFFGPTSIVNWRLRTKGSLQVLSKLVLCELYPFEDDGFEIKQTTQIKVLELNEQWQCTCTIYRPSWPYNVLEPEIKGSKQFKRYGDPIFIKGADGQPLDHIPFYFIGSKNNDYNPDNPGFYDLASLNIAHYRNSAEYEEAVYLQGQPTMILTGLTDSWIDNVLKGQIVFGSRGGIPLPDGGDGKLLQAEENSMMKEAMEHKERMMISIGAKLIEQKTVQMTATESRANNKQETSYVASVANNVSQAFKLAVDEALRFEVKGLNDSAFEQNKTILNTDFGITNLSFDELEKFVGLWMKEAITFEEMRAHLRSAKVATEDDKIAKNKIATDAANALSLLEGASDAK